MDDFRDVLTECGMHDCGESEPWFTWERGNHVGTRIRERLDIYLINDSRARKFGLFRAENLVYFLSDHFSIYLTTSRSQQCGKSGRSFKFETFGASHPNC